MTRSTFRVEYAVREVGDHLQANLDRAKTLLHRQMNVKLRRGTRTGERYRVPKTRRYYTASAPGEPPKNRTGVYADSIVMFQRGMDAGIATEDQRGPWLEYGTRDMAPRPHFRPVISENGDKIRRIMGAPLR